MVQDYVQEIILNYDEIYDYYSFIFMLTLLSVTGSYVPMTQPEYWIFIFKQILKIWYSIHLLVKINIVIEITFFFFSIQKIVLK